MRDDEPGDMPMLNDAAVNALCDQQGRIPGFMGEAVSEQRDVKQLVLNALLSDTQWQYRSSTAVTRILNDDYGYKISIEDVQVVIKELREKGWLFESPNSPDLWGHRDKVDLDIQVASFLKYSERYEWRAVNSVAKSLVRTPTEIETVLNRLWKAGKVRQNPRNEDHWGHVERVGPMEMSKEERTLGEQELWDKAHPISIPGIKIDPATFQPVMVPGVVNVDPAVVNSTDYVQSCRKQREEFDRIKPGPKNQMLPASETPVCESRQEGFDRVPVGEDGHLVPKDDLMLPQHRRQHQHHMKELRMVIDRLPVNLIVKALSDALAHTREVSQREHIKADRIERVNQFIVSLRRHFGYMGDSYRTEREYLSAQLARKEVWYDAGVLNPSSISGLNGDSYPTSLKSRDVENWLAQAEAMTPSFGDLKAEIEKDFQLLRGSILVAEACNKTTGELNRNADKVLEGMAALAADM